MARDPHRSRLLRKLAEQLLAQVPKELLTSSRADLSTSLVRQWLTCDGHATLIFGQQQHYLRPALGPGDELRFDLQPVSLAPWLRHCMVDWELGEEEMRRAIRQLNLGQAAQIENRKGDLLRLWVDPQKRSKGIELLKSSQPTQASPGRDYIKLARHQIETLFGKRIAATDKEDLVAALVRQWASHNHHALILAPQAKFHIVLTPEPDGGTKITTKTLKTSLPRKLRDCGLSPEEVLHFIHLLNLGLTPEITDEQGRRCLVRTDPINADVIMNEIVRPPGPHS